MVLTLATGVVFTPEPTTVSEMGNGELPVDLPRLGSQRRVVMSQMRRAGWRVVDARGDHIVFSEGPKLWPGVTTTTYIFRYLVAEEVRLDFAGLESPEAVNRAYTDAKRRLSTRFGAAWLERLSEGSISTGPLRTTFEWPGFHAELTTSQTPEASVRVAIKRSARFTAKQEVESIKSDTIRYDASRTYFGWSTKVKRAMEALFDDFGELPMVDRGARIKGGPLTVALREISLPPAELPGVDRSLIERRFTQMTSGHWDLESSDDDQASDVEFRVVVAPTEIEGTATYAIRLEAFSRKTRRAGAQKIASRPVYTANHRL